MPKKERSQTAPVTSLVTLLLLASFSVYADTITGKVIGISDGDTLTLIQGQTQHKIRLAGIDAPEKAQPFGQKSKQSLSNFCFSKIATVDVVDTDRYGRYVGVVTCERMNANDAQVQSGMAWVYRKYAKGFGHLYPLEEEAKAAKRGLWSDHHAIEPWVWRKERRANADSTANSLSIK